MRAGGKNCVQISRMPVARHRGFGPFGINAALMRGMRKHWRFRKKKTRSDWGGEGREDPLFLKKPLTNILARKNR